MDIEATGGAELQAKLARMEKVCEDMRAVWPEVGRIWAAGQESVFAGNNDWPPLANSTVIRKRSTRVLVETGSLMQGATNPAPIESGPLSATFGVPPGHPSREYAFWHYLGRGVPKRDPVPNLTGTQREAILKAVFEPIQKVIK